MDVFLREAEKIDISDMYKHLNREFVKKYSFGEKEEWFLHKKKYIELMEARNVKILIINDLKLRFLGILRLDFEKDMIRVSIFILEKYRGMGIAKGSIKKLLKEYGDKTLFVEILVENEISTKLFGKFGFEVEEKREDYIKLIRKKS